MLDVALSPEVAAVLAAPEPPLREVVFTDLGARPDDLPDDPRRRPGACRGGGGFPWEGPRHVFTHLLGESPTWLGPGGTPDFCGGRRLEPHEYCLGCDRAGIYIPTPTDQDMKKRGRRRAYRKGSLKGGKG